MGKPLQPPLKFVKKASDRLWPYSQSLQYALDIS